MKQIAIVGMGLGKHTITSEAQEAVQEADVLLGAPRMLAYFAELSKPSYPYYLPEEVADFIEGDDTKNYVVLVSGDVGFFSAATKIADRLKSHGVQLIPGISSANAFFAKLMLPWQDAKFISAHGRQTNIVEAVRRNRLTFCLTGNNVKEIGMALYKADLLDIKVHLGENLGTERERIYEITPENLMSGEYESLTVLLFINESFDDRSLCGIPDNDFIRFEKLPMTKSEVRAVVLSKLRLRPDSVCFDVGAGTGSVTIEMALSAYNGHVYAVERREDGIALITQNAATFHVGNITPVFGEAPAALETLPSPDVVFIGGSGGELGSIISTVFAKNSLARIVVTAVTIETVSLAMNVFKDAGLDPEIVQLNVSRSRKAGRSHLMEAQNPITIISAGGVS